MSGDLSVADVLDRAAELLTPEGAWTQGCGSRDEDGNNLDDADPDDEFGPAVCFCAAEAIYRLSGRYFNLDPAHQALRAMVGEVARWNDAPNRTQADVVGVLRKAASRARGEHPDSRTEHTDVVE